MQSLACVSFRAAAAVAGRGLTNRVGRPAAVAGRGVASRAGATGLGALQQRCPAANPALREVRFSSVLAAEGRANKEVEKADKKAEAAAEKAEEAKRNKKALRVVGAVWNGLLILAGYLGYKKYQSRSRLKSACDDLPPEHYIKADFPLTRYRDCVLPKDLVMSGTMDELAAFEVRPEDVFVASFPKSGTTWLQEVVCRLVDLEERKTNEPRDGDDAKNAESLDTRFPYLEFPYPGLRDIAKRKNRRLIKTHLPLHLLPESVRESNAKVLYIYRNPKDVAVSYFHFAQMLTFIKFIGSFQRFANMMINDQVPYAPYFPHVKDYVAASADLPGQFLSVCYESMQEDPRAQIRRVAAFLGLDVTDEDVEAIARETTFKAMKDNPRTNYKHWDDYGIRDKKKTEFMRKGKVGDYENYFTHQDDVSRFDQWIEAGTKGSNLKFKFAIGEESKTKEGEAENGTTTKSTSA